MFYLRLLTLGLACKVLTVAAGVKDLWGQRHQAQEPVSAAVDCQATATATNAKTNDFAVTPDDIVRANEDGFFFENPSLDCKYASQPSIYSGMKTAEKSLSAYVALINKDVQVQVMGHHPLAGIYHDRTHFFVNALYRLSMTFKREGFRVNPIGIHGGCDEEWSVQEINFKGQDISGKRQIKSSSQCSLSVLSLHPALLKKDSKTETSHTSEQTMTLTL